MGGGGERVYHDCRGGLLYAVLPLRQKSSIWTKISLRNIVFVPGILPQMQAWNVLAPKACHLPSVQQGRPSAYSVPCLAEIVLLVFRVNSCPSCVVPYHPMQVLTGAGPMTQMRMTAIPTQLMVSLLSNTTVHLWCNPN